MKRFGKVLLGAVVSGVLLFSAQAAELPDTAKTALQSAMAQVQQEVAEYGKIRTLNFTGENCEVLLTDGLSNPDQYLVTVSADGTQKFGILDKTSGKLVVPAEYDQYTPLVGGQTLVGRYTADDRLDRWFADETGELTPLVPPDGYTVQAYDMASDLFLLTRIERKPVYEPYGKNGAAITTEDVSFFALADRNMHLLLENIDSVPTFAGDLFIVQTGSTRWERVDKSNAAGNGKCGLFDAKTGKFVGKQDFNQIFWYDQHWIGTRSGGTQSYLLDGSGGETLLPANAREYSSWAKAEADAAMEHGIGEVFFYPKLDITRANFTGLAMNLYRKIHPDKDIPAPGTAFSDCKDDPNVRNAAALGIVTGYEDGTFRPYQTISRQEAAVMLERLYTVLGGLTETVSGEPYTDDEQLSDWARDSVYAMRRLGVMQGKEKNAFCPQDGYTAEQAVVTMERLYQSIFFIP